MLLQNFLVFAQDVQQDQNKAETLTREETRVGVDEVNESFWSLVAGESEMFVIAPDAAGVAFVETVRQEVVASHAENVAQVTLAGVDEEVQEVDVRNDVVVADDEALRPHDVGDGRPHDAEVVLR